MGYPVVAGGGVWCAEREALFSEQLFACSDECFAFSNLQGLAFIAEPVASDRSVLLMQINSRELGFERFRELI